MKVGSNKQLKHLELQNRISKTKGLYHLTTHSTGRADSHSFMLDFLDAS
jgi:hypothetical protein